MFCSQEILQVMKIVLVDFGIWKYWEFQKRRLRAIIIILRIFTKILKIGTRLPFKENHPLIHDHFEFSKKHNPADLRARKRLNMNLANEKFWWEVPSFLKKGEEFVEKINSNKFRFMDAGVLEIKNRSAVNLAKTNFTKQVKQVKHVSLKTVSYFRFC